MKEKMVGRGEESVYWGVVEFLLIQQFCFPISLSVNKTGGYTRGLVGFSSGTTLTHTSFSSFFLSPTVWTRSRGYFELRTPNGSDCLEYVLESFHHKFVIVHNFNGPSELFYVSNQSETQRLHLDSTPSFET